MYRLTSGLVTFLLCFLLASPPVRACIWAGSAESLFFNDSAQSPSDEEGMVELPPDADVIAEVVLAGANTALFEIPTYAYILRVIKTSDARVRSSERIPIKYVYTSCGPDHRSGDQGIIAAKIGADIEDRLVLCLYSHRFHDGAITSPTGLKPFMYVSECDPGDIKEAKKTKQAAEKGDVKAQIALGLMYEKGQNVVHNNNTEALKWLHSAADSGDAEALYQLGAKYKRDKNDEEALKWFMLAADKGNKYAQVALDRQRDLEAIVSGARKGEAEAQYQLGQNYDRKATINEAVKWYKLAALQGHLKAANRLGAIYDNGGGVKIDHAEAIKWYRIAAEKGDREGQLGLGGQYEFLDDYNESLKWYKLAADQGDVRAMERVGVLYQYGRGVEQNYAEAVKWYRLALEGGFTYVLPYLVNLYSQGLVVVEDKVEVAKWFRLSAEEGNRAAQFGLGRMYQTGENVEQNEAEAIKWYLLAADQGNDEAQNALAEMDRQGRGLAANYAEVERRLQLAADKRIRRAGSVLEALRKSNSAEAK